jgi:hypothetical protein
MTRDIRFDEPLYSVAEAATCVGVPRSTFVSWARGYERQLSAAMRSCL